MMYTHLLEDMIETPMDGYCFLIFAMLLRLKILTMLTHWQLDKLNIFIEILEENTSLLPKLAKPSSDALKCNLKWKNL